MHGAGLRLPSRRGGLMLSAYLFDQMQGKRIDAWTDALHDLGESEVLWLDLQEPSEKEENEVRRALDLSDGDTLAEADEKPSLDQREAYLKVTAVGVTDAEDRSSPEAVSISCFIGMNWILTAHASELAVVEGFRERAEGGGELGILDAPSFLAVLLGWVVTSYLQAFDEIEVELEEFDVGVLRSPQRDAEQQIGALVEIRQRVSRLRRSLALHRDVFAALTEAEFDPVSTEESAARFSQLAAKTDTALVAARDAKDAITGSFDVLIARTEHRTNEIIKVLTVASILLLPGALIAGVMGMNVNFKASVFAHSPIFWAAVAAIVLIAATTLAVARLRRWI
jgi:magnesium transporter